MAAYDINFSTGDVLLSGSLAAAFQEYGVTPDEWEGFKKRHHFKLKAAERAGL